jgi:hypothetical protein
LLSFVFVTALTAGAEAARLRLSVPVHGVSHVAFYAAKEKVTSRRKVSMWRSS